MGKLSQGECFSQIHNDTEFPVANFPLWRQDRRGNSREDEAARCFDQSSVSRFPPEMCRTADKIPTDCLRIGRPV